MTRRSLWVALLLVGFVIASAIGVAYAKSQTRRLFAERESLRAERDALAVEWRQLQLELATFAAHGRIESLARRELNMRVPAWGEIRIVQP